MATDPHLVLLVVPEGLNLLDLAGPAEAFRSATLLGADPGYRLVTATADGEAVRSECGIWVGADASLAELAHRGVAVDTLVVVGGLGTRAAARDTTFVADLGAVGRRAGRVTSVCTGAEVLAATGLLDDHQATTHWASCDRLAADHPAIDVVADRIYVRDRDRWTSAGVTSALDLALALVEHDHGAELAHAVAGWLVVFVRRPGGQTQFSAQLSSAPARTPAIRELQRWLPDHLDEDLSVAALASRCAMSVRTFGRAFRAETGTSPAAAVEALRVEAARRLLETSDLTVGAVARRVGLRSPEVLHRAFRRRVGTTPAAYRAHFNRLSA
ncbi:GlxA family transcriptional regulator [Iamia sp. SCSIO 61187]|uniref:GlxA family transcriptional regulator n=1 Tax=Iamia sp. SCSIO 61187 TaxID=2722752 RepID=UPI001C627DAC|nr:GlxA family transcriptional regulator [Iamia sp. SCSIO 61187]